MTREELKKSGWRIIDPNNTDSTDIALRPEKWSLPEKYSATNVIELSDIDLLNMHFCPEGKEVTALKPKGIKTSQIIADIVDGQPTLVVRHKHKGVCKICKRLHIVNDPCYGHKLTSSDQFDNYIIKAILTDKECNIKYSFFEPYGVSKSYSDKLVKGYLDKMRSSIKSVCPCDQLILYPFEYQGQLRCCVCGLREGTDETVLLSILPDYSISTITHFLINQASYFSNVDSLFCDLNPAVYKELRNLANEAHTAIITKKIIGAAEELRDTQKERKATEFTDALGVFINIVYRQKEYNYSIPHRLAGWWAGLSDELQRSIEQLWSKVEPCLDGCYSLFKYDSAAVDAVLHLIEKLRTRGTSFEYMVDRMLFTIPAVRNKLFPDEAMLMAWIDSPLFELHDFYVDIPTLMQVFEDYSYPANSTSSITPESLSKELAPIFRRHNVRKAILFGSYAKGLAHPNSDIDILVDSALQGLSFVALIEDIRQILNKDVDLFDISHIDSSSDLMNEIRSTGIVIYPSGC